ILGETLEALDESYKLEQSTLKLAKGGETSIVYGIPSKIRDPATCLIIAHGAGGPMHSPFIRYFHTEQAKQNKQDPDRFFIGGKSMGGRIASQVAAMDGVDVDGLFFLGYPLHPPGKTEQLRDAHLYRITRPMIFLSGTRDSFARKQLLEEVVAKLGPNAQLHWIENGDHSFRRPDEKITGKEGTHEALAALVGWLKS